MERAPASMTVLANDIKNIIRYFSDGDRKWTFKNRCQEPELYDGLSNTIEADVQYSIPPVQRLLLLETDPAILSQQFL
jgi:hypothetical protein